jgi:hypothetical protein
MMLPRANIVECLMPNPHRSKQCSKLYRYGSETFLYLLGWLLAPPPPPCIASAAVPPTPPPPPPDRIPVEAPLVRLKLAEGGPVAPATPIPAAPCSRRLRLLCRPAATSPCRCWWARASSSRFV